MMDSKSNVLSDSQPFERKISASAVQIFRLRTFSFDEQGGRFNGSLVNGLANVVFDSYKGQEEGACLP